MSVGRERLEECYAEHGGALLRFAASQVGSTHADDVVARAVLGLLQSGVADVDDLRAYLYRSVSNASRKHWRDLSRRRRRDLVLLRDEAFDDLPSPSFSKPVLEAMTDLSVQQRAVIHLCYVEDLSPSMIAERLGVSDGTVRRQLARARDRLRKALDD